MPHSEGLRKLVVTGGPSSGKTMVMKALEQVFGSQIAIVPEAATMLFEARVAAPTPANVEMFQRVILPLQQYNQDAIIDDARRRGAKAVVFDRGLLDGAAYIEGGLEVILEHLGQSLDQVYSQVGTVINLQTVARYKPELFGTANNPHRVETNPQDAIDLDDRIQEVWRDHPDWRLIDGGDGIESVIEQVIDIVRSLIDREIERKWLLGQSIFGLVPDSVQEIEQFYTALSGHNHTRIRKITEDGRKTYIRTTKMGIGQNRGEYEEPGIPAVSFDLERQNIKGYPILKVRSNYHYGDLTLSQDEFRWPPDHVTLECEFETEDQAKAFDLPPQWQELVVREITNEPGYSNLNLALYGLPE